MGFLFNICATAEASNVKFGVQPTIKSHPEKKWDSKLPKISGFPFNISATAKTSDFKFGTQLGFAKTHHKITHRGKVGVALG